MESIELVCQLKTSIDWKGSFQSTTTNSNDNGFSEGGKGFLKIFWTQIVQKSLNQIVCQPRTSLVLELIDLVPHFEECSPKVIVKYMFQFKTSWTILNLYLFLFEYLFASFLVCRVKCSFQVKFFWPRPKLAPLWLELTQELDHGISLFC
jgi:hypothetical protein